VNKEQLIKECLGYPESTVNYPYGEAVEVIKNKEGKSFALIGLLAETDVKSIKKNCDDNAEVEKGDIFITLKCPPELIFVLRDEYKAVIPGYYSNKLHWNTIILGKDVPIDEIKKMIRLSHDLVTPAKQKKI